MIVGIDNEKVDSVRALLKALSGKSEGTVAVKLVRNRAEQTVTVTLEKRALLTPRSRTFSPIYKELLKAPVKRRVTIV